MDQYFIPSVPQFKRDLSVDLDDTIGDEFFEKLAFSVQSPTLPPPKTQVHQRLHAPPTRTVNVSAPIPPARGGGVRRSLIKPGRPSVGSKPVENAVNADTSDTAQPPAKAPSPPPVKATFPLTTDVASPLNSPVKPKAPLTRSQSSQLAQQKPAVALTSTKPVTAPQSTFHNRPMQSLREPSKLVGPAANTRVRRSLMKPGRPSVGSLPADNNQENEPQPSAKNVEAPAKAPLTRLQASQLSASATKSVTAGVSSFLNRLQRLQQAAPAAPTTPKGPAANTRRRSFMDPTISSASKSNTAA